MDINQITEKVIGAAIEVHRQLGPGLLENIYELCLCREFDMVGLEYKRQLELPIQYKGVKMDFAYRVDILVENQVVLEIKSVSELLPIHDAQILTYLKLGGWPVGLIINFNERLLKNGVRRLVSGLDEAQLLPMRSSRIRESN